MACEKTSARSFLAATPCGIARAAHKVAAVTGAQGKRAADWIETHPGQTALAGGSLYALGMTALYDHQQRRLQLQPGRLAQSGVRVSLERTGRPPDARDRALAAEIDRGIWLVQRRIGRPDIGQATLGDDFAFVRKLHEMIQVELTQGDPQARGLAKTYAALKPLLVGRDYLTRKIGRLPFMGRGRRTAVAGLKGRDIAFNLDDLRSPQVGSSDGQLGGSDAAYVAAHEALHRLPRAARPRGPFGRTREEALVDAIARRLVAPDGQGRRSGYELIARVADWNARHIAQQSGQETLDVLIRQLGVTPTPAPGRDPFIEVQHEPDGAPRRKMTNRPTGELTK